VAHVSSFQYQHHTDLNVIEIRPTGVVELSDILSYAREVLAKDLVVEGTVEYYDLSGMTNLSLDYRSARSLVETLSEWLARGWQGSVYFTPEPYQFGMIRMIGGIAENIEGASDGVMVPRRQPIALDQVRNFINERRRIL